LHAKGAARDDRVMPSADYVIVGAGSAGCVLANRISEDPGSRVLLIEAGGRDRSPNITIPAAFAKQFRTKLDWGLDSEPEPHCDGRSLFLPRGKSLGGSSSMNAMLYARGRPWDYDLWESRGATGWGWGDVKPYFLKSENNARGASEDHGVGGPLNVMDATSPRPLTEQFLAAAERTGIPRIADYNGPEQDGASAAQITQRGGKRLSCADAFLRPVMKRPNLEVVTKAQVLRVELDGDRATGVRYRDGKGREQVASAAREVILAAGAYGSPQLLLLSGIGPADHLREVGRCQRAHREWLRGNGFHPRLPVVHRVMPMHRRTTARDPVPRRAGRRARAAAPSFPSGCGPPDARPSPAHRA